MDAVRVGLNNVEQHFDNEYAIDDKPFIDRLKHWYRNHKNTVDKIRSIAEIIAGVGLLVGAFIASADLTTLSSNFLFIAGSQLFLHGLWHFRVL